MEKKLECVQVPEFFGDIHATECCSFIRAFFSAVPDLTRYINKQQLKCQNNLDGFLFPRQPILHMRSPEKCKRSTLKI